MKCFNVLLLFVGAACLLQGLSACEPTEDCVAETDFQALATGTSHNLGASFMSNTLTFGLSTFIWGNGNPSNIGFVKVEGQQMAGGAGKDLQVNNVNLELKLSEPARSIVLRAGFYGGNLNLNINGDFLNFGEISAINGLALGGVNISASGSNGIPGTWKFEGPIQTFSVGGQELFLDDICVK